MMFPELLCEKLTVNMANQLENIGSCECVAFFKFMLAVHALAIELSKWLICSFVFKSCKAIPINLAIRFLMDRMTP
jgi:hypothetical protein